MSPDGLIERKGSTCTARKPDRSTKAADKSVLTTWSTRSTGIKVLLQPGSRDRLQKLFGLETEATDLGFAKAGTAIAEGDGLIVDAGYRAGDHFQVVGFLDPDQGPRHIQLGLKLTKETFA